MKVTVRIANSFKSAAKPLLKKYPSFKFELIKVCQKFDKLHQNFG
jgi:hypothetical protein